MIRSALLSSELRLESVERRILAVAVRWRVWSRREVRCVSRAESCSGEKASEGSWSKGQLGAVVKGLERGWYLDGVVDDLLAWNASGCDQMRARAKSLTSWTTLDLPLLMEIFEDFRSSSSGLVSHSWSSFGVSVHTLGDLVVQIGRHINRRVRTILLA